MSKVNFVSEFNAIMRYARDNCLPLRERMLWIALFYVANDRAIYNEQTQEYDWPDSYIQVSNGELGLYCCLDKRGIETMRNTLKQRGILDFRPGLKNKRNPAYKLNYLTVGCKIVPNDEPNSVPSDIPNVEPNHVPRSTEQEGMLGAKLLPTVSPYPKDKYINQTSNGIGANQGMGFVNLCAPPVCAGFVPLPREEDYV